MLTLVCLFLVGFFIDFSSSILFIEKFVDETKGIPFREWNIDNFILIFMFYSMAELFVL